MGEKAELERICKKLAIAELLCTQINKFHYTINLPFDYLLPIIPQWKSVYIPHQTNLKTLKYVYCLNAFRFIKRSFYVPINIIIPPQKIAIVAMELSLRLNYEKYQKQQNEQDLKDEVDLICNEIINAIYDIEQFGTKQDIEKLKGFRKNTLKTAKIHKQLIEQQLKHQNKFKTKSIQKFKKEQFENTDLIEYPFNFLNEQKKLNLSSPNSRKLRNENK